MVTTRCDESVDSYRLGDHVTHTHTDTMPTVTVPRCHTVLSLTLTSFSGAADVCHKTGVVITLGSPDLVVVT